MRPPRVLGAVLAGGRASRFGSDKAMALYDGVPLIVHVVAALRPQLSAVVICGGLSRPTGERAIDDRPAADLGPLGGLNAALHHAVSCGFDAVVTVGCDMPVLPGDLVARLGDAGDCAALVGMPLVGRWPATLAPLLDRHLAAGGDRSMRNWVRMAGAVLSKLHAVPPNVNTRDDLAALEEQRGRAG